MREIPILFRGPLVRAILDDRKTVTRRLIKHEHDPNTGMVWQDCDCRDIHPNDTPCVVCAARFGPVRFEAGDTLWVKETHAIATGHMYDGEAAVRYFEDGSIRAVTDERSNAQARSLSLSRGRPSIHMPRWASRLTLHVVSVRAERLQDIDDADARREGVEALVDYHDAIEYAGNVLQCGTAGIARGVFASLWDSINGKRPGASWHANPWVWRVEFKRAADAAGGGA